MIDNTTPVVDSPVAFLKPSAVRSEGNAGYRRLEPHRAQRRLGYAKFTGRHYMTMPDQVQPKPNPVNLTQQHIRTLLPFLAFDNPKADVVPLDATLAFEAKIRKKVADEDAQSLKLGDMYQAAVIDSVLSGVTFGMVGVKAGGQRHVSPNKKVKKAQEFESLVDFDDITVSPIAATWDDAQFIAYRYRITRREAHAAIDAGTYGGEPEDYLDGQVPNENIATREEAHAIIDALAAIENQGVSGMKVVDISRWRPGIGEHIDETVYLWDFVFQIDGETWIVTMPGSPDYFEPVVTAGEDKFLSMWKWDGPDGGPLSRLSFIKVPYNLPELPLEQLHRDLAEAADTIANKILRQVIDTKSVIVYDESAEDLAMTIKTARQNTMVRGDPDTVKDMKLGGLLPEMIPASDWVQTEWQNALGNPSLAAGNEDLGKTATAFNGLMSRVQGFMDFLRSRVEGFASEQLRKRMYFMDKNPAFDRTVHMVIGQPPYDVGVTSQLGYQTKQGDFSQFEFKVKAYSMQHTDPAIQAQQVMQLVTEALPTALELQMQFGLDAKGLIRYLGQRLDAEEIESFLPDPMWQAQAQQAPQMAAGVQQDPMGTGAAQQQQPGGAAGARGRGGMPMATQSIGPAMSAQAVPGRGSMMAPGAGKGMAA